MEVLLDYYKILAVPDDATPKEIKAGFRKKAMRYHPDHNPGREKWANKKLQGIIEAYDVLMDPGQREDYDRQLFIDEDKKAVIVRKHKPPQKTTRQKMEEVARFPFTPWWARSIAFAFLLFDNDSEEET